MKRKMALWFEGIAPVLFLGGMFLLTSSLGLIYIQQELTPLPRFVLGLASCLIALAAVSRFKALLTGIRGRRLALKLGLIGSVATIVVAFFGVNVFAGFSDRRIDATATKSHTLKPTTLAALGRLKDPLHLAALWVGPIPHMVEDLFEEFARAGGPNVTFEIFDPIQALGRAAEYGSKVQGNDRRIIVEMRSADGSVPRREELNCKEAELTEERLSAAMIKVTKSQRVAYFLRGHGEYDLKNKTSGGYSKLAAALAMQNIETRDIILASVKEVPRDADVLVIAGPERDLDPTEEVLIRRYLEEGGHAFFLSRGAIRTTADHNAVADGIVNPTFDEILKDYGVVIGDDIVVDLKNNIGNDVGCPVISRYPAHEKIVSNIGITYFVRPRSVSIPSSVPDHLLVAPLVKTMSASESWAESDPRLFVHFDPDLEKSGPVNVAAVLVRPLIKPGAIPADMVQRGKACKIIVFGTSSFVTNEMVERYSNLDLAVNCVSWLADYEPMLASRLSDPQTRKLEVTSRDLRIALVVMGLLPAFLLTLGVGVWWRRTGITASL